MSDAFEHELEKNHDPLLLKWHFLCFWGLTSKWEVFKGDVCSCRYSGYVILLSSPPSEALLIFHVKTWLQIKMLTHKAIKIYFTRRGTKESQTNLFVNSIYERANITVLAKLVTNSAGFTCRQVAEIQNYTVHFY